MKINKSILRAVVERVTEIEYHGIPLYVFEHLNQQGVSRDYWVQNWECSDVTEQFTLEEHKEISHALHEHYRCKANSTN